MSWELILKANYDFVMEPDADWLGIWKPDEDEILINLSTISKYIRQGGPNAPKGFSKDRPFGLTGKIDRRTERDLTNMIIEVLQHESIHAATHDMVNNEIMEIAKNIRQEMQDYMQTPEFKEEVQRRGDVLENLELPDLNDIYEKNRNMYYMIMQEWAVRLMEGKPKEKIINDLTGYLLNRQSEMGQKLAEMMMLALGSGDPSNLEQVAEVHQQHEIIQGKAVKWLMESLMDVQANIDSTFMSAVDSLDVEENMPEWFRERMVTRRKQIDEARGGNNE